MMRDDPESGLSRFAHARNARKSFISRISVVADKFNGNSVKMVTFSVFPNNTTGIQKFRSFSKFRGVSKSKLSNHSYLLDYS